MTVLLMSTSSGLCITFSCVGSLADLGLPLASPFEWEDQGLVGQTSSAILNLLAYHLGSKLRNNHRTKTPDDH